MSSQKRVPQQTTQQHDIRKRKPKPVLPSTKYLFEIPKNLPDLTRAEIDAVLHPTQKSMHDDYYLCSSSRTGVEARLALPRAIHEVIADAPKESWEHLLRSTDISLVLSTSWKLIAPHATIDERKRFAKILGERITIPVDMHHPVTTLAVLTLAGTCYLSIVRKRAFADEEERKPHNRIAPHPTGMTPRMARVMINLTGIPDGGTLYDPMCGAGGFLIEAYSLGLTPIGSDFDRAMTWRAILNLREQGHPGIVTVRNALTIRKKMNYVIADLPYGRGSKTSEEFLSLYDKFLSILERNLGIRAVIIAPKFRTLDGLLPHHPHLVCRGRYEQRINDSMTRVIYLLEPEQQH